MYTKTGTYYSLNDCPSWIFPIQLGQQSSKNNNEYQLLYTYCCNS